MSETLEVWIDAASVGALTRVGRIAHDRGHVRFQYDREWLSHPRCFDIDPDLSLDQATFHPDPSLGHFGIFLDSSPDRWGQTLMKRREALEAKDLGRPPRTLYAWDYLIGVQDATRQGALRYRREGEETFLSDHPLAAPPVTQLGELEEVAKALTSKRIDDLDALRRWLSVLVAPGASLGGARPKANFTQADGSLWMAKFPSRDDELDIGGWEGVVHDLAVRSGVEVPPAKVLRLNSEHHTFCVKRFDRANGRRVFYASAMTLLRRAESEGASYLDLAQFLLKNGARAHIRPDLAQLYRRVVFNIAVGNRDDHLRNHGFILDETGWRLAPAFDLNPNIDKADHVLMIDDREHHPSLDAVRATASLYELKADEAGAIIKEVATVVATWRNTARRFGLAAADIVQMEGAFMSDFD